MAFFSGTDTSTLQKEGADTNCFVSLIVNNAGDYCAAVTRKIQVKSEVTIKNVGKSYEFFGEGTVAIDSNSAETASVVNKEIIEYYMLDVIREETSNPMEYLDDRFNEIKKKKVNVTATDTVPYWIKSLKSEDKLPFMEKPYNAYGNWNTTKDVYSKDIKNEQLNLWSNYKATADTHTYDDYETTHDKDEEIVDKCIAAMITCSVMHLRKSATQFNWRAFIENDMNDYYEEIFNKNSSYSIDSFDQWCDFIVNFIVEYFEENYDEKSKIRSIARKISETLEPYADDFYIDNYCKTLEYYFD